MQKFKRQLTTRAQAWWLRDNEYCWTCLHEMRVDFEVPDCAPRELQVYGQITLKHRNVMGITAPVGWGAKFILRRFELDEAYPTPPTSGVDLPYWKSAQPDIVWGSKDSGNIASLDDHYGGPVFNFDVDITRPGKYRLEPFICSHSTAWPHGTNGLLEVNQNSLPNGSVDVESAAKDPYSYLTAKVITL